MSRAAPLRVLSRHDVATLLDLESTIDAVAAAFRLRGEGRTQPTAVLAVPTEHGGFHVKAARLDIGREYFTAKMNANFPANPERHGLPTIQGVLVLADARDGRPLAIVDSGEITARRTAAATAVAARHLARRDARVLTLIGCGLQGRIHVRALRAVLPLRRVFAIDRDPSRAEGLAGECAAPGLEIDTAADLHAALGVSDLVVTCTPSHAPVLYAGAVRPGTFVAAVGADHPEKQEIDPRLMAASRVVVDDRTQCAAFGDLHHAIAAGAMTPDDVWAELGEVVAGRKPGRGSDADITLFDSTGLGLQDVAAAARLYERACECHAGVLVDLDGTTAETIVDA